MNENKTRATANIEALEPKSKSIEIVVDETRSEETTPVVKFSNTYNFEGKEIKEIDLSKLNELSGKDSKQIKKLYKKIADNTSVSPETTDEYAMAAASFITGLPLEFFEQIRLPDLVKIRLRVINFIFSD